MAIRCTNSGLFSRSRAQPLISPHIFSPPRHRIYVVCPHLTPERGLHPRMVRRSLGSAPHAPLPCVGSGPAPSNTLRPFFVGEDLKDAPREQIQEGPPQLRTNYSRVGRVERAVRRPLVYYGPLPTGALIRSIYGRRVRHWHDGLA